MIEDEYNIAPTQNVLAIRRNPETGERTLDALRWGLIPNWAKDEKIAYKTINARVETVDTAPSYRQAFKKRRCLIPVDGFYEWKRVGRGKIPYSKDDSPFVFAGRTFWPSVAYTPITSRCGDGYSVTPQKFSADCARGSD
jgi:putative SOS response-associated peptidase YedK